MISIYNHTSYREFLCDYYTEQKSLNRSFSYQYFADKAGFKSKTFLHKVIKGEKALAKQSALKIAKAIGLKKRETDYFITMVNFNNASNLIEKEYYFHHLQSLCKNHKATVIRENQYSFFNNWYNSVVCQLVTIHDYQNDYKRLAKAVNPPITPKQAENAVKLLLDLEMIKKLPSGKYIRTEQAITAGGEIAALAVKKYQRQCMKLGAESIDRHKKPNRDVSTLTMDISEAGFEKVKQEIQAAREKIADIVHNDGSSDRVYQLNFQFFPVSTLPKKED